MAGLPQNLPEIEKGWVWIAGAGPGDPGLLTLLALKALQDADSVVYDALVNERILEFARPGSDLIAAGKRGGRPSADQADISEQIVALAKEGKRVLRLKGGDPFVFGRGGEEAEALVAAGVPFRIVPGITAGVGGLAYAGIPLTHRDVNSAVTFVTGHTARDKTDSTIDWQALAAASPVLVVYMALATAPDIADRLMEAGRQSSEPAAVLSQMTTPSEQVLVSSLGDLASDIEAANLKSPAMLVVGDVVSYHGSLAWRSS